MAYNDIRTPEGHAAVLGEVTLDPETQELDYSVAHNAASQLHGWSAHKLATTEAFTLLEGYYQEALTAALAGSVPYTSALSPYALSGVVPPIGPGKHLVVHSALTPWITFEDLELPATSTQVFDYVVKAYGYLESTPTTRVNETATIRVTRDSSGNASLLSLAAPFSDSRLRVTVGTDDITIDVQAHASQDWIWDTEAVRQLGGNATILAILPNGTSEVVSSLDYIPSILDFGGRAGSISYAATNGAAWTAALASVMGANGQGKLRFPGGVFDMPPEIMDLVSTGHAGLTLSGSGTTIIRCSAAGDWLLRIRSHNIRISGITFDGAGLADEVLVLTYQTVRVDFEKCRFAGATPATGNLIRIAGTLEVDSVTWWDCHAHQKLFGAAECGACIYTTNPQGTNLVWHNGRIEGGNYLFDFSQCAIGLAGKTLLLDWGTACYYMRVMPVTPVVVKGAYSEQETTDFIVCNPAQGGPNGWGAMVFEDLILNSAADTDINWSCVQPLIMKNCVMVGSLNVTPNGATYLGDPVDFHRIRLEDVTFNGATADITGTVSRVDETCTRYVRDQTICRSMLRASTISVTEDTPDWKWLTATARQVFGAQRLVEYRGDNLLLTSDVVTGWTDTSGNARHATKYLTGAFIESPFGSSVAFDPNSATDSILYCPTIVARCVYIVTMGSPLVLPYESWSVTQTTGAPVCVREASTGSFNAAAWTHRINGAVSEVIPTSGNMVIECVDADNADPGVTVSGNAAMNRPAPTPIAYFLVINAAPTTQQSLDFNAALKRFARVA
jgi:hypothetical protein